MDRPATRPIPTAPGTPAGPLTRAIDRRAARHSALLARTGGGAGGPVVVRPATAADAEALDAVAQLDSARVPAEPLLVAELDGRVVAAIGVLDRRVIADPWTPTAAAVDALQAVACEVRGPERRRRWAARLRWQGRPAAVQD